MELKKAISSTILPNTIIFFTDTAPTKSYTLSLHDALPICEAEWQALQLGAAALREVGVGQLRGPRPLRSEEHTSELQSRLHLVCRLLLEKKNCVPNDQN